MKTAFEVYTPEKAREILEKQNVYNRRVDEGRVRLYRSQMSEGKFIFQNGESIKFAKDPKTGKEVLIDGQHRLLAIAGGKISVSLFTVREIDFESFKTFDRGMRRSNANDILIEAKVEGLHITDSGSFVLSAAAGLLVSYDENKGFRTTKGGNRDGICPRDWDRYTIDAKDFYEKNREELLEALNFCCEMKSKKKTRIVNDSIFVACFFLQTKKHPDFTKPFWKALYEKGDEKKDVRIDILRDFCISQFQQKQTAENEKLSRGVRLLRAIVLTWNSIIEKRPYTTLRGLTCHYNDALIIK